MKETTCNHYPSMGTDVQAVASEIVGKYLSHETAILVTILAMLPGVKSTIPILESVPTMDLAALLETLLVEYCHHDPLDDLVSIAVVGSDLYVNGSRVYSGDNTTQYYRGFQEQVLLLQLGATAELQDLATGPYLGLTLKILRTGETPAHMRAVQPTMTAMATGRTRKPKLLTKRQLRNWRVGGVLLALQVVLVSTLGYYILTGL